LNLVNQNKLLYCRYITCNTTHGPVFSHVSVCVWLDVEEWRLRGGGRGGDVKICERVTKKLWGWRKWMLCSLWSRLSCILRLTLMYILICFTDIWIELSLAIILAK